MFADEVRAAWRFKEALAGLVDLDRSRSRILVSDRAGQHIGIDASGVMVPARFPTGRVVDSNHRECLAGDVGKFLRANQPDIVVCRRTVPSEARSGERCTNYQERYSGGESLSPCK